MFLDVGGGAALYRHPFGQDCYRGVVGGGEEGCYWVLVGFRCQVICPFVEAGGEVWQFRMGPDVLYVDSRRQLQISAALCGGPVCVLASVAYPLDGGDA